MQRNVNSGGTMAAQPACAACKHQRKKCDDACTLAPYFPADRTREFQAVHRVFGVSNVTKLVKNVSEMDRNKTVDSLIWEALCRQKDPVSGPYGEYRRIYDELKLYRSLNQTQMLKIAGVGMGWNSSYVINNKPNNGNGGGIMNSTSNGISYSNSHDNWSSIIDSSPNSYPSTYTQSPEILRSEREASSVVLPLQHQSQQCHLPINGLTFQQYYLSESDPCNYKYLGFLSCADGEFFWVVLVSSKGQGSPINSKTMHSSILWEGSGP